MDKVVDDSRKHLWSSNLPLSSMSFVEMGVRGGRKVEEVSAGVVAGRIPVVENIRTMAEERIDVAGIPSKDELMRKKIGIKNTYIRLRAIFGQDDRKQVQDTTCQPWSAVCSLLMKWGEKKYIGTGCLIGPDTVITCGHNLYDSRDGGWASEITVMPGRNGDQLPFGCAKTDRFFSVEGWIQDADPVFDYGCIKIPEPLGEKAGWIGYAMFADADILQQNAMKVSGYPSDKQQFPGSLWYAEGKIDKVTSNRLYYKLGTQTGESGSPVWMLWKDEKSYIVGIHNYGGDTSNKATRISKSVYENMVSWSGM